MIPSETPSEHPSNPAASSRVTPAVADILSRIRSLPAGVEGLPEKLTLLRELSGMVEASLAETPLPTASHLLPDDKGAPLSQDEKQEAENYAKGLLSKNPYTAERALAYLQQLSPAMWEHAVTYLVSSRAPDQIERALDVASPNNAANLKRDLIHQMVDFIRLAKHEDLDRCRKFMEILSTEDVALQDNGGNRIHNLVVALNSACWNERGAHLPSLNKASHFLHDSEPLEFQSFAKALLVSSCGETDSIIRDWLNKGGYLAPFTRPELYEILGRRNTEEAQKLLIEAISDEKHFQDAVEALTQIQTHPAEEVVAAIRTYASQSEDPKIYLTTARFLNRFLQDYVDIAYTGLVLSECALRTTPLRDSQIEPPSLDETTRELQTELSSPRTETNNHRTRLLYVLKESTHTHHPDSLVSFFDALRDEEIEGCRVELESHLNRTLEQYDTVPVSLFLYATFLGLSVTEQTQTSLADRYLRIDSDPINIAAVAPLLQSMGFNVQAFVTPKLLERIEGVSPSREHSLSPEAELSAICKHIAFLSAALEENILSSSQPLTTSISQKAREIWEVAKSDPEFEYYAPGSEDERYSSFTSHYFYL